MEVDSTVEKTTSNYGKIDLDHLLKLKFQKGYDEADCARILGVSPQAVNQRLTRFKNLICEKDEIEAWNNNKKDFYTNAEIVLLNELVDSTKLEKATVNNLAYAARQVHDMRQIHEGKVTENIGYMDYNRAFDQVQEQRRKLAEELGLEDDQTPEIG
jgi:predicted transcriptional regulator